jgi:hypothetical protein
LLIALVLAGCGGGSSSSLSSAPSGAPVDSAEAAWAKEVQAVMRKFENNVSATMVESISTSSAQQLLEPLYRSYAVYLARLATELEATKAPQACVPVRKKMAAAGRRYAELHKELGEGQGLSQDEYSLLVEKTRVKLGKYGSELTSLTAKPTC